VYVLDVPDTVIESAPAPPDGWDGNEPERTAQAIGDSWYDGRTSPALLVPNVVTLWRKVRPYVRRRTTPDPARCIDLL
jgi:hypothetical protein